jgi:hypothetical protein
MAAVLAAILAAFLAGAIALYRERRLEARRLRVAARVVQATIAEAMTNWMMVSQGKLSWKQFGLNPAKGDIVESWDQHRDILAGHLCREEWTAIQDAISGYLMLFWRRMQRQRRSSGKRPGI